MNLHESFEKIAEARDVILEEDPDMQTFLYDFYRELEELLLKYNHEIDTIIDSRIEYIDQQIPPQLLRYSKIKHIDQQIPSQLLRHRRAG